MRRRKKSAEMPIWDHFKELRKVLLYSAYTIALGTVAGWVLSDYGYRLLAQPLLRIKEVDFITTTPLEPIYVKLKISLVIGVIFALPVIFWQLWSFILPALKKNEKNIIRFMVLWSIILFIGGLAFAFCIVLPTGLKFLLFAGGGAVEYTPFVTKLSYLDFIITFLLSFGLVFQLPVVLLLLVRLEILSPQTLVKHRKWAFFLIVVISVIVSPTPDPLTQFLMVGPLYLLYEVSIWLGYLTVRKRKKAMAD